MDHSSASNKSNRNTVVGLIVTALVAAGGVTFCSLGTGWGIELVNLIFINNTLEKNSIIGNAAIGVIMFLSVWLGGGMAFAIGRIRAAVFKVMAFIAVFLLIPFAIGVAAVMPSMSFWLSSYIHTPDWKPLPGLAEPATEVVDADMNAVYVRTAGGNMYRYETLSRTPAGWTKTQTKPDTGNGAQYGLQHIDVPEEASPPKNAVSTLGIRYNINAEMSSRDYFAVLPDGSVWWWRDEGSHPYVLLFGWLLPLLVGIGMIVAFVPFYFGAGLTWLLQSRNSSAST